METKQLHVIFGSGQIGSRIASALLADGHRVRVVSRAPKGPKGIETRAGDARDLAFAASAAEGATVVYDTTNPLYHHWKTELLPLGRGPLHAAKVANAPLVALDCLYMYGIPDGKMTEASPMKPVSKKGELRKQLAQLRLDAIAAGQHVAIVRASDFFGPDLPASWWSDRFFDRVLAGKSAEIIGDPEQPHSYTYADDVARAMTTIGAAYARGEAELDGIWHAPTLPATSTRELGDAIGKALGARVTFAPIAPWMLRLIGIAMPFMGELREMAYQWKTPYVIDDSKIRARFGLEPTPLAAQIAATVSRALAARPSARAA